MRPEHGSSGRRTGRGTTIYDVARAAGVAPSTVSRAFSRPGRVNGETAEHIRQVAVRLGYRSNSVTSGTSTTESKVLALVVADVTNPFYGEIILGAEEIATLAGYTIQLTDTQESDHLERTSLERALPTVDGILLASTRMTDAGIRMVAKQRPTVVLNRAIADLPCVVVDNPRGVRQAAEHLAELGHSQITYVAGPEASWVDGIRWRSLLEAAADLDLKVRRMGPYPPTIAGGARAAPEVLARRPASIIAYNDQLAIGLIAAEPVNFFGAVEPSYL